METSIHSSFETRTASSSTDSVAISKEFCDRMSKRRSIREFQTQPIEREIILNAIQTAGSAPSGANRQPWHFALITSQDIKNKIRFAAEQVEQEFYTNKNNTEWQNDLKPFETNSIKAYLSEAPVLIAVFSRNFCQNNEGQLQRTYYPVQSTGIATGFLLAALHSSGLATLTHTPKPMFFLNKILNLDKTYQPFMIIVVGFAKQPVRLPNLIKKTLSQIMTEH